MMDANYASTRIAVWKVKSAWDVSRMQLISIKKMTQGDRIRSMSDEELAEFLCNVNQYSDMQVPSKEEINVMLGWLRSEVEE